MPLMKRKSQKSISKEPESDSPKDLAVAYSVQRKSKVKKMANGGAVEANPPKMPEPEIHASEFMPDEERASSIAEAIMRKREAKKYADGGEVELGEAQDEIPNDYEQQDMEAAKKEVYDDSQISPQPMDSNEHGDSDESEGTSMISKIRMKMKSKSRY